MRQTKLYKEADLSLLLKKFNKRDRVSFGEIYILYINEFIGFANKLFKDTPIDPEDVVQDVFIKIWNLEELFFENENALKAYVYVSIRNNFTDFIRHNSYVAKYGTEILNSDDFMVYQITESETLSLINQALDLLPRECAKVFKLHIDGWNVKDIALYLGKSERTILIQKQTSISILQKKLSKSKLMIITLLLQ